MNSIQHTFNGCVAKSNNYLLESTQFKKATTAHSNSTASLKHISITNRCDLIILCESAHHVITKILLPLLPFSHFSGLTVRF